jgi:hypothetical protein
VFDLKPISREAIPEALALGERYRLLNEPAQAESICEDVLRVEPYNQTALVMLLLSLTDQFDDGVHAEDAKAVAARLDDPYQRAYYGGIICERKARSLLKTSTPGAAFIAYDWFAHAMDYYDTAEALRPPGNDHALLRWNTCARFLRKHPELRPQPEERPEPVLSE